MKTEITGYWTFYCKPSKWQIDKFLVTNSNYDTYQITEWQQEFFKPGQLGIIRVGIDSRTKSQLEGREKLKSGVYAIVEILSEPHYRTGEPDKYWIGWSDKELKKPIVDIKILANLLERPLLFEQIKDIPEIYEDKYLIPGFQASTMPLRRETFNKLLGLLGIEEALYNGIEFEGFNTKEDIYSLEKKYSNATPEVKEVISKRIERGFISQKIKELNNYKCLICEALNQNPYAFKKKDGGYYIETHHIMPVSGLTEGSLGITNLITVCPNHHRQLHYGNCEISSNTKEKIIFIIDGYRIEVKKTNVDNV